MQGIPGRGDVERSGLELTKGMFSAENPGEPGLGRVRPGISSNVLRIMMRLIINTGENIPDTITTIKGAGGWSQKRTEVGGPCKYQSSWLEGLWEARVPSHNLRSIYTGHEHLPRAMFGGSPIARPYTACKRAAFIRST